jgi:hypothetical protein
MCVLAGVGVDDGRAERALASVRARLAMLDAGDPLGADLPIRLAVGAGVRLDRPDGVARLDRTLAAERPALVIIDSFTRVHAADENDAGGMADVLANAKALIREHGCAIVLIHHLRKKGLVNDPGERLRGSSELRAWPYSILAIDAADDDPTLLRVEHVKSRHGRRLDPFQIRLDIDGAAGSARLLYQGDAKRDDATRGGDLLAGIQALKQQLGDDGADAVRVAAWLDVSPDTVRRKAKKLAEAGLLTVRKVKTSGNPKDVFDLIGAPE